MLSDEIKINYIGGPTILLEVAGLRFITDPTFDEKDTKYKTNFYVLHKLAGPAITPDKIGKIDFVLLSHDHHFDNLDNRGRRLLSSVDKVYTTKAGSKRLGGNSIGLENWQKIEIPLKDGRILNITATPCRHGPVDGDRGPVVGFVLNYKNETDGVVYITGDTVWFEGIAEVAKKFSVKLVFAFMGAAVVKEVGPAHLTMTAKEGIILAKHFPDAKIFPLHFEGWKHFSESRKDIEDAFKQEGILKRLIIK
ncbi:MAG TPA: MBL fold metallo-hydrolase [Ignavibacteriaceae bacterium]|nr:MBL fold metallo-hydrolase [Ignavibacteriaceae bacterium]